jgi:hypothetical protein
VLDKVDTSPTEVDMTFHPEGDTPILAKGKETSPKITKHNHKEEDLIEAEALLQQQLLRQIMANQENGMVCKLQKTYSQHSPVLEQ